MVSKRRSKQELLEENEQLRIQLEEIQETLQAIQSGEVDAVVVSGPEGDQIFTLKSEDHTYRTLVERMSEGAATLTHDGAILYCNTRLANMLETQLEKVIGASVFRFVTSSDTITLEALLRQAIRGRTEAELSLLTGHGSKLPVHISISGLQLEEQQCLYLVAIDITERKQAEEAIKSERDKLQSLIDGLASIGIGIDIVGSDYQILYQNEVLKEKFGECAGELCYQKYRGQKTPCDSCPMIEAIKSKEVRSIETTGVNGRTYELLSAPLQNPDGTFDKAFEVTTDITERKQVEEKLRESEERFKNIVENAEAWVWEVDVNGKYTYASDVCEKILGYKPEELIGKYFYDLFTHDEREQIKKVAFEVFIKKRPFREFINPNLHKNGKTVWLSTSGVPVLDENGKLLGYRGADTNVTERKQAEEALRESENKLRNMFERANDGIVLLNLDGKIIEANDSAQKILGLETKKELLGKNSFDIIVPDDRERAKENFPELLERGYSQIAEYAVKREDGTVIPVETNTGVLKDEKGKPSGIVVIFRDISERTALDEERQRAAKLESIGTLAGGIAHDFNNYLTSVIGNISLARKYIESGSVATSHLHEAEEAVIQARDLTQQLLTFARGGSPIKKTISVGSLLEDTTRFALRGSSVKPEFSIPDDLWSAEADESQIRQVISNLIINAVEAMQGGGFIQIKAENHAIRGKGTIQLPKGKYIQFTITDHGRGIPKEHLARIFDPYFTTKKSGSGLGLATVYSIIKAHGGHIDVKSHDSSGTTFRVFLPASKNRVPRPKKQRKMRQLSLLQKSRVLIMDDNEPIRKMLGEVLSDMACEVGFAADGEEAIKQYVEAEKNGQPFDVVIMDLTIVGGMGGMEAIKQLLQIDPGASVIVSSGYSTHPIMSDYKKYGFSGVISKPYNIDELENTIDSLLKKKLKGINK